MVQAKLQIVYNTFKELVPRVPTYYIPQGEGGYILSAVAEEFFTSCRISSGSADAVNFETYYKSSGSQAASLDDALILGTIANGIPLKKHYQTDSAMPVTIVGREGSETIWSTHNFCDRTTWYGDSLRETYVTLSNSGDNLTFSGSHQYWIDMDHGKVFDEIAIKTDYEHGFSIVVVVAGVTQSAREPFKTTGGDYSVNYRSGSVTFFSPVTSSVTCSYSYENGSSWYLAPEATKALDFEQAEIQFSQDITMNDSVRFVVEGPADIFAPELVAGNILPSGYMLEIEETKYDTIHQMIDEALGSYPTIPAIGGSARGLSSPIYGFPFTYNAVRRLKSSYGLRLRVRLQDDLEFDGERATATFYCVARNESELT
jgi:hypothetical protein